LGLTALHIAAYFGQTGMSNVIPIAQKQSINYPVNPKNFPKIDQSPKKDTAMLKFHANFQNTYLLV